jgi:hypothetical protein
MTEPKQTAEELTEQDEEFLECINDLSEPEKNCIISYLKDKCDLRAEEARRETAQKILEILDLYEASEHPINEILSAIRSNICNALDKNGDDEE